MYLGRKVIFWGEMQKVPLALITNGTFYANKNISLHRSVTYLLHHIHTLAHLPVACGQHHAVTPACHAAQTRF